MTRNQIEYWRNKETERSNAQREREERRSNYAREAETQRHNVEMEKLQRRANRTNLQSVKNQYALGTSQLSETQRANLNNERMRELDILLQQRSRMMSVANSRQGNLLRQQELQAQIARNEQTYRTNLANIGVSRDRYQAEMGLGYKRAYQDYILGSRSRDIQERQLSEQMRSNRANERIRLASAGIQLAGTLGGSVLRGLSSIQGGRIYGR